MTTGSRGRFLVVATVLGALLGGCEASQPASPAGPAGNAEGGRVLFEMKCMSCHTLGSGPRIGPDLRGVTARRTRDWLVRWMKDPIGMSRNDPEGRALLAQFKNVPMPPSNLTDQQLEDVLAYLEADAKRGSPRAH